jgi:formylmethanofuran dehydrogenase subunit E
VDAIQSLTGCTYGKGNLIHRDYGKNAFTFYRRSDGKALRVISRPDVWGPRDPEREALSARVRSGQGTPEEQERFHQMQAERTRLILSAPLQQLFSIQAVDAPPPKKARIHRSLTCEACGEATMETRTRQFGGQTVCIPCFEQREARL